MKSKNRILIIVAVGVAIGLALTVIKYTFKIPDGIFYKLYFLFALIIIAAAVILNCIYNIVYIKRMRRIIPLLENGSTEEYIDSITALKKKAKGRYLNKLFSLNLSAGYFELGRYNEALDMLLSLPEEKLKGDLKLVYGINLCLCYFHLNRIDEALKVYDSYLYIFDSYRNNAAYEGNIFVTDISAAIARNEIEKAKSLLETEKAKCTNQRIIKELKHLENILDTAN